MTTFYVETFGDAVAEARSEQIIGLLQQAQFQYLNDLEEAFVIVLNVAPGKVNSESFVKKINEINQQFSNKIIVLAGCLSDAKKDGFDYKKYPLVGIKQTHNIAQVLEEALHENVLQLFNKSAEEDEIIKLDFPITRKNNLIAKIPVAIGCKKNCKFCSDKKNTNNLDFYSIDEIIQETNKALEKGAKIIHLVSPDVFAYGKDTNEVNKENSKNKFVELLNELIKLPQNFKILIGSGNASSLQPIKNEILHIYQHPKVFKKLELFLTNKQAKNFVEVVELFRKNIPSLNLITNVIIGKTKETEEKFWEILETLRKTSSDEIKIENVFKGDDPQLVEIANRRYNVVADIANNTSRLLNEKWFNWQGSVLIERKDDESNCWIARNGTYKEIILNGEFNVGDVVEAKIVRTGENLQGAVVDTRKH